MTTAADVVLAVAHDLKAQPLAIRPAFRYFGACTPTTTWRRVCPQLFGVAHRHQSTPMTFLAGGAIARVRLDKLTPRPAEFVQAAVVFSRLAGIDPYFHTTKPRSPSQSSRTDGKKYRAVTVDVRVRRTGVRLAGQALHGSRPPIPPTNRWRVAQSRLVRA